EFGEKFAKNIAKVLRGYTKFNGRRKPENLFPHVLSIVNNNEADRVLAEYEEITELAEEIYEKLPKERKDAYYQLVLYPTKASYLMYKLHICTAKNRLYAKQGRVSANRYAKMVNEAFVQDYIMSEYYNKTMAKGKWDGMMNQAHLGQTGWRSAEVNMMPKLELVSPKGGGGKMFVALPDSDEVVDSGTYELDAFSNIGDETRSIVIGNQGDSPVDYTVTADQSFIKIRIRRFNNTDAFVTETAKGSTYEDNIVDVCIDWSKIPAGKKSVDGNLTINGTGKTVVIKVKADVYDVSRLPKNTFVDTNGVISIEAEHYSENVSLGGGEWKVIDDYGRSLSSMKVFPTELAVKKPGVDSPYLEYHFTANETGKMTLYTYCAPTNNLSADLGMKYSVAIDDEKPQIVETFANTLPVGSGEVWDSGVMMNCRILATQHELNKKEIHTLRIYMVDAGFTLQKLVIDCNESIKESFLGPQESYFTK
ncbi:MAG TPA: hypothetical protein VN131_00490, partial [Mobilitalea sp.]|nr:hypothetical protein [Mobilitalea sp.]